MADEWFKQVPNTAQLSQGDLIPNCPVVIWGDEAKLKGDADAKEIVAATVVRLADIIVLSQSCDIEHGHISKILVCLTVPLSEHKKSWEAGEVAKGQNPTPKAWKKTCESLRDGYVWSQALLNECTITGAKQEHRVVYFNEVFTLPKSFLEAFLRSRGPRLQLLPPYNEHLSQSFARFFMRVGLPNRVTEVW